MRIFYSVPPAEVLEGRTTHRKFDHLVDALAYARSKGSCVDVKLEDYDGSHIQLHRIERVA